MAKTFNSSVDCVVLTDYLMKRLVELVESWGKRKGEMLQFSHKEKHLTRVRAMQKRFVDSITDRKSVVQFCHTDKDEKTLLNIGQRKGYQKNLRFSRIGGASL